MAVIISDEQAEFHKLTELASLLVQVPFLIYLGRNRALPQWARWLSWALLAAVVYVDGSLWLSWAARDADRGGGP